MDSPLVLRSATYRQFPDPVGPFVLVTDAELACLVVVDETASRPDTSIVPCEPADQLGDVLAALPDDADVLVVRPRSFLTSPNVASLARQRIAVLPCGSTPMTDDHVAYFLSVLARTDPVEQAKRADAFFDAVDSATGLRLVPTGPDVVSGASCAFDAHGEHYVWNQQAGPLGPGEQQIAPAGELSVLPMEITDFDPSRRLALDGTFILRGMPIVHAGYDPGLLDEQAALFESLRPLAKHAVAVTIADGLITEVRSRSAEPAGLAVARALDELLDTEPRYRAVWELGFGINTAMSVQPANCGCNEVYGGTDGVVHMGLGLTPYTRFALTFLCPDTALVDDTGTALIGTAPSTATAGRPSRIRRTRSASCGCH
jgi:hypothetical protein